MCGRLACTLCPSDLRKACNFKREANPIEPTWHTSGGQEYVPKYNVCPTSTIAVLANKSRFQELNNTQNCTDNILVPMRWGLLPRWDVDVKKVTHTHNARIESITTSNMYNPELTKQRRCAILCDGYYEWQSTQSQHQPYYIFCERANEGRSYWEGKPVLRLAGIFSRKQEGDAITHSCTVITKEADSSFSWLHHRMPFVLTSDKDLEEWLERDMDSKESVDFLLNLHSKQSKVQPEYIVKYHPVDKKYINNSSCNDENCIKEFVVKPKNTLDKWLQPAKKAKTSD